MRILIALILPFIMEGIQCTKNYTEKLEIFPLRSSSYATKSLWHLEFNFVNDFNPESPVTDEYIIHRRVLETIFVLGGVTDLRMEIGMGKPNPFYLDDGHFNFPLPRDGKAVFMNSGSSWDYVLY